MNLATMERRADGVSRLRRRSFAVADEPLGYVDGPNVYGVETANPVGGTDSMGLEATPGTPATRPTGDFANVFNSTEKEKTFSPTKLSPTLLGKDGTLPQFLDLPPEIALALQKALEDQQQQEKMKPPRTEWSGAITMEPDGTYRVWKAVQGIEGKSLVHDSLPTLKLDPNDVTVKRRVVGCFHLHPRDLMGLFSEGDISTFLAGNTGEGLNFSIVATPSGEHIWVVVRSNTLPMGDANAEANNRASQQSTWGGPLGTETVGNSESRLARDGEKLGFSLYKLDSSGRLVRVTPAPNR